MSRPWSFDICAYILTSVTPGQGFKLRFPVHSLSPFLPDNHGYTQALQAWRYNTCELGAPRPIC